MNCDPAKRYLYIEDFEEKYDVVGMQRSDIEDLLGSPTWTKQSQIPKKSYPTSTVFKTIS